MDLEFVQNAADDLQKLKKENSKYGDKVDKLIDDICRGDPYKGIGKPEQLKKDLSGWYSRRITKKHRLVYRIKNDAIQIISCYGHY